MKKAFTLAEVMIVLAIIGILVAILLPTAQNLTPDENLLKFKKANTSLTTAIRELVNSDKYYYDGDLGLDKEGNKIVEAKYFCSTLADILTTKSVNCSEDNLGYNSTALANLPNIETDTIDGIKIYEYADCMCKNNTTSGEEIKLSDNTIIYTINPYYHFGSLIDGSDKRLFNLCSEQKRYKFICLDIDNLNEGEDPFGYAIRADGKIIYGARAQAWIKANINNSEDELSSIATTNTCTPTALSITPENDVCKVVQQPVVTPTPTPTPEPEPTCTPSENCITCNPSTNLCTECEDGYNLLDGVCVEPDPTCELSEHCVECNPSSGACTKCEDGYKVLNGACEVIGCGDLAMEIKADGKDMCIMKFNAGDDALNFGMEDGAAFALPATITNVAAGSGSCTPSATKFCCWSGTTSTSCDSQNGGYNGCTRTVCDWRAANEYCSKLTYLNKTWQLPTSNEWASIGSQLSNLSIGKGTEGMMLCDHGSGYSSARCNLAERCSGSYNGYCGPGNVWSSDVSGSSAYRYYLAGGAWYGPYLNSMSYAFSVRCVSDL